MTDGGSDAWQDGGSDSDSPAPGRARYVFGVRFRLDTGEPSVSVEPATFETKLSREADQPGTEGWLFFRDNLWRGELGDEQFIRETAEDVLGVDVESVDFRELRTDQAYLDALRTEIGRDLDRFNAENVRSALHQYLGSSIHVRD